MSVDPQQFKKVMSQFASGVTVITTIYQGTPIGIAATSFSGLSLDPPLVLVCLDKKLFTHQVLSNGGVFAVNILHSQQRELGMRFAGMYPNIKDRFAGLETHQAITGCPILPDTLGWVDCRVWAAYNGGDHTIFVGEVLAAGTGSTNSAPLIYHNRTWQGSVSLSESGD